MAKKASDNIKYYHNPNGPTITTVARPVMELDGSISRILTVPVNYLPSMTGA